jgi:hypothetical protein
MRLPCGANQNQDATGEIIKLWDYKAHTTELYFDNNQCLIDYVNSQPLTTPLICLGDGHDGVWNLVKEFATPETRREILDWYHLKENLYKVGGSLQRLKQAEALLWLGQVAAAADKFTDCQKKAGQKLLRLSPTTCSPDCQLQLLSS